MKKGLGKGLDALIGDNSTALPENTVSTLRISQIEPNGGQPRKDFDAEALTSLSDSIREHGVLQPLLVRPVGEERYQIVAGERRWRAARQAGLTEVPVIVREMEPQQLMEIALVENLQREDLNPVEEADGYQTLMEKFGLTQEQIAQRVGRSRPAVANALRLLNLPKEGIRLLKQGKLSSGHARTLLALSDEKTLLEAAKLVIDNGLSVRQTEQLVKKLCAEPKDEDKSRSPRAIYMQELAQQLASSLGRKVKITGTGKKGMVTLEYYDPEDLERLLRLLGHEEE